MNIKNMKSGLAFMAATMAWLAVETMDAPMVRLGRDGICYTPSNSAYAELRYYRDFTTLAACERVTQPTIAGR